MATPAAQPLLSDAAATASGSSRAGAAWFAVIACAFIALHYAFLRRMFHIATDQFNADWSHAAVLPFIAGWLAWRKRREMAAGADTPSLLGVPIMLVGILAYLAGIYPIRNDMVQGYAMLVTLAGMVLLTFGTRGLRAVAVPIAILALGVKISDRWWEDVAWRLQVLAANGAAAALQLAAVDARVDGAVINIARPPDRTIDVNVAEACAGLRMLMSFIVLATLVAFVPPRRAWQRLALIALAVPIAVMVNILRVAVLGYAFAHDMTWATGTMHEWIGIAMLLPALLMLLAVAWLLDRLFIELTPQRQAGETRLGASPQLSRDASPLHSTSRASLRGVVLASVAGASVVASACTAIVFALFASAPAASGRLSGSASVAAGVGAAVIAIASYLAVRRLWPRTRPVSVRSPPTCVGHACAAGMLVAGALGLSAATRVTGAVFYKAPVPLRHSFSFVSPELSRWSAAERQPELAESVIDELRTHQFLYRAYKRKPAGGDSPHDALLHLAYYTGTVDTVPHVPERCFLAQGFRSLGTTRVTIDMKDGDPTRGVPPAIPVTLFEFEQSGDVGRVIYFFIANRRFIASPDELRLRAFDLRERTAYYCKVELTLAQRESREETLKDAAVFLRDVLPSVMDCLPEQEAGSAAHEVRR